MEVLGLVPARGGSKGVPKKNIKLLAGQPLIAYTIEGAKRSKLINRLIVSTDDQEIARIASDYGAEIPFIRPRKFAQDDTPDLPVFRHALEWLEKHEGYKPDLIVHLRPTAPLRKPEDIDNGIMRLWRSDADSLRSVCVASEHPNKMWKIQDGRLVPYLPKGIRLEEGWNLPRQALDLVYYHNGVLDVIRRNTIMEKNSMTGRAILPFIQDKEDSVDLDTELDFLLAEVIIKKKEVLNG